MLGLGKTGTVRASATASSARSRDIYHRYAVALYRQALLTVDDSVLAEQVVYDVIVNERALALVPARGEDNARHRGVLRIYPRDMAASLHAVLRRLTTSSGVTRAHAGLDDQHGVRAPDAPIFGTSGTRRSGITTRSLADGQTS